MSLGGDRMVRPLNTAELVELASIVVLRPARIRRPLACPSNLKTCWLPARITNALASDVPMKLVPGLVPAFPVRLHASAAPPGPGRSRRPHVAFVALVPFRTDQAGIALVTPGPRKSGVTFVSFRTGRCHGVDRVG